MKMAAKRWAAVVLLAAAAVGGLARPAEAQGTIWTGTLTVGNEPGTYGYGLGRIGSLDNTTLVYRNTSYVITEIFTVNFLYFGIKRDVTDTQTSRFRDDPSGLILHVENQPFRFDAANFPGLDNFYWWPNAPTWNTGETISLRITYDLAPPDAPQNVKAVPGNRQIGITWEPASESSSAPNLDYAWRQSPNGTDWGPWQSVWSPHVHGHTVTGLENGQTYYFQARARNRFGWGGPSDPVSATPNPTWRLSTALRGMVRGGETNTAWITITNDGTFANDQTIELRWQGNALTGEIRGQDIVIPAGENHGTTTLSARADGGTEHFDLPTPGTLSARWKGQNIGNQPLTIFDDEKKPVISMSVSKTDVREGESIEITVKARPTGFAVATTVELDVGDPNGRLADAADRELTFATGETSKTVTIETADDSDKHRDQKVNFNLHRPFTDHARESYTISGAAEVLVRDNDETDPQDALPEMWVTDAEAHEVNRRMVFQVSLDLEATTDVSVDYTTQDGTARAGQDYTATSGTLDYNSGDRFQTITVPIIDDSVPDDGETFTIKLSNVSGARFRDDEATGTIHNSEEEAALPPLTASFTGMPGEHDRESFTFGLRFSEDVAGLSYKTLRDAVFSVTNGQVTRARRQTQENNQGWTITVEPDSRAAVTVRLPAGTVETADGRGLESALSATVAGPPSEPLTASIEGMPAEHRGEGGFHFRVVFSEDIGISFRSLREDAFTVTGGRVTGGKRVDGRRDLFRMTVRPDSDGDVTITLPAGRDCGTSGAICTKGDNRRPLTNSPSATVAGPVGIAVADARVEEGAGALLAFAVTLSRAASGTLTVDYATSDGTATAGTDYTAASGTLTFTAGESSQTIEVTVLDDSHDEGEETLTLRLSDPSGGRVTDGEATGTIANHDSMPRALLARFGRTAAVHVVEHVEERLAAPREPGFRGRFAGRELRQGMEREMAVEFLSRLAPSVGTNRVGAGVPHPMSVSPVAGSGSLGTPGLGGSTPMAANPMGSMPGTGGGLNQRGHLGRGLGGGNLLTGASFVMNHETRRGGILSFWSRGAQSQFAGRDGDLSLDGRVRTTMFGADYAKGPLVTGLSLSHSRGLGGYSGVDAGEVTSSVTGLYPWLGYKVSDRITVWGVTGYGKGALRLTPGAGTALRSGLSMAMTAGGMRGELADSVVGGFGLAFKADALWVGTGIEGVDGPQGRLAATSAAVTRFRTALEASRGYRFQRGLSLQPSLEVGLRRDGGDAENGAGVDVGGGLIVSDALTGLSADVRVRMLLVHQDRGFRDRGVSISFSYNPTPATPLGFTAKLTPSWGGQATSGAQALWGRETMAGMAHGGVASGSRLQAELGYGMPVGVRLVGTPRIGIGTSEHGRDYRLGYGLTVLQRGSMNFELGIEGTRRESSMQGVTDHGALARLTASW